MMNKVLLVVLLIPCLGVTKQETDPYKKGLEILKREGSTASIKYFRELTIEKGDVTSFFYYGWSLFRDGYIDESEEIAERIIEDFNGKEGGQNPIVGNCYYLLGTIERSRGQIEQGLLYLEKAIDVYHHNKMYNNVFKTLCVFAAVHIQEKNFKKAKSTLDEAQKIKGEEVGGYFFELNSRIAFGLGQYGSAVDFAQRAHDSYLANEDLDRAMTSLSGLAFFQLLSGDVSIGIKNTAAVDDHIYSKQTGYEELSYYNAINWLLIHRCSKKEYKKVESDLDAYAEKSEDVRFNELLEFVKKWKCEDSYE